MVSPIRLSAVDRAWLLMDRPTNPMMIVALLVLSRPLDRLTLSALIKERFLTFERFRCYPSAELLNANWVEAREFDVDTHVLAAALPRRAGQKELEELIGVLASTPFNACRPLWSFHIVERYRGGSAV
ncbi:MAG TPA: wax ester/triacylglycerol synthase domain-containing protein, partial [Steroidobacteraceae bacterium]|nr:wax ester/triacylglycerol synthase domain-containing protein [Steroidobacteraceae bacterium]